MYLTGNKIPPSSPVTVSMVTFHPKSPSLWKQVIMVALERRKILGTLLGKWIPTLLPQFHGHSLPYSLALVPGYVTSCDGRQIWKFLHPQKPEMALTSTHGALASHPRSQGQMCQCDEASTRAYTQQTSRPATCYTRASLRIWSKRVMLRKCPRKQARLYIAWESQTILGCWRRTTEAHTHTLTKRDSSHNTPWHITELIPKPIWRHKTFPASLTGK